MTQIPKGRLVHDPYKPICRDCAIYFLIIVYTCNPHDPCFDCKGPSFGGFFHPKIEDKQVPGIYI